MANAACEGMDSAEWACVTGFHTSFHVAMDNAMLHEDRQSATYFLRSRLTRPCDLGIFQLVSPDGPRYVIRTSGFIRGLLFSRRAGHTMRDLANRRRSRRSDSRPARAG